MATKKKLPETAETAPKAPSLGSLIDQLEKNRRERRKIEAMAKPLEDEYKELKAKIMEILDATGQLKAGSELANVAITTTTVPQIDDVEALVKYLIRTKNLHVFLAQPMSTPSWRELVERNGGKDLPGSHTFVKRDLSHTSVKS